MKPYKLQSILKSFFITFVNCNSFSLPTPPPLTVRRKFSIRDGEDLVLVDEHEGFSIDDDVLGDIVTSQPDVSLMVLKEDEEWSSKFLIRALHFWRSKQYANNYRNVPLNILCICKRCYWIQPLC